MGNAVNDKYFTKPSIVDECLKLIDLSKFDIILEPSAGCGSFYHKLPQDKSRASDISPDIPDVIELDFYSIEKVMKLLDLVPSPDKRYLSIGNPPFGKNSCMAIDFFNGCAEFSHEIAFIVPRTFRKDSVQNRLNMNFHLKTEWLLPKDSFLVMDPSKESLTADYDVPCTFQVWEKTEQKRQKVEPLTSSVHLDFVDKISQAKYAFRRVGGLAGNLYDTSDTGRSMSAPSHYYINCSDEVAKKIRELEWGYYSSKYDTAGNPSISKSELIKALNKIMNSNV